MMYAVKLIMVIVGSIIECGVAGIMAMYATFAAEAGYYYLRVQNYDMALKDLVIIVATIISYRLMLKYSTRFIKKFLKR